MKIPDSQTDIGAYLPKFYTKETQINNIINPLLQNIRKSKISSYSQLQGISFVQLRQDKFGNSVAKSNLFTEKQNQNCYLTAYHSVEQQKVSVHQQIRNLASRQQKIFSQPQKLKHKECQLQTLQISQKNSKLSDNLRSKTSDLKKKQKKILLGPPTADFSKKIQQIGERKKKFLFENKKNQLQNDDNQISNCIELKNFVKAPSISLGKFSNFKRHLVQEINLQQIQNKLYHNPQTVTNYQNFFDRIMKRKKLLQNNNQPNSSKLQTISQIDRKGRKFGRRKSPLTQKEKGSCRFINQTFNQTIEVGKSLEINRGISDQKNRKRSVRAVLLYKKDGHFGGIVNKEIYFQDKSLDSIQITGTRKNILLPKK